VGVHEGQVYIVSDYLRGALCLRSEMP